MRGPFFAKIETCRYNKFATTWSTTQQQTANANKPYTHLSEKDLMVMRQSPLEKSDSYDFVLFKYFKTLLLGGR